jgi:hypothetical protein
MAARAAEEDEKAGKKDITPYWRTLKGKGELNEKYPGGLDAQVKRPKAEGHTIQMNKTGKPNRVKDWGNKLVKL